jgi:hypothetical protein
VYRLFKALAPNFEDSNWTSSNRKIVYPDIPSFYDGDSFADFTYHDYEGKLAQILGLQVAGNKTFHIEITTSKAAENGFAFSARQLDTVRAL